MAACPPPPLADACGPLGRARASTRWASPRPSRSSTRAGPARRARPPASTAACSSPTGTRTGRPIPSRILAGGPRAGRRRPRATARAAPTAGDDRRRRAGWRATPGDDHYAACGRACRPVAERAPGRRLAGPGAWPTTTPWSTARPPYRAGLGWYGKNANCCCPGRAAGSCSARSSPTPRSRSPTSAGGRRLRAVPPLPRRLPDRRHRRPGRGRRPPLPGLAGAGRGRLPRRAPRGARRPHLRLRRLPGGVPAQPASRRRRGGPRSRTPSAGSTCSTCSTPTTRRCSPPRPLVHPRARPALPAPQRAGGARQRRRRRRRSRRSEPCCVALPPDGERTTSLGPLARAPAALDRAGRRRRRRSRREAPARHQRLPAQDRRDPVVPLGAVAAAAARRRSPCSPPPYAGAPSWDAAQPFRVVRSREPRAAAHPLARPPHRRAGRRGRAPTLVVLDPALPLGLARPAPAPPLRRRAPRGRGHRARPAARVRTALLRQVLRGAPARRRRRRLPAGRGRAGRRVERCPSVRAPGRRHRPLPPARPTARARGARPGFGPARRRAPRASASAGSCPARGSTS